MNLDQLRKKLASHLSAFVDDHPDMKDWGNDALKLVLKTAEKDKGDSQAIVEVPSRDLEDFINRLTGSSNARSQTAKRLKTLDGLFARWHADDLAYVPSPVPVAEIKRDYCVNYDDGDELLIATFDALWAFFLYRGLKPETDQSSILNKSGMSEEDHRACSALFAMLGAGDLLVQSPAYALGNLSVENIDFYYTWTISGWYKRAAYRWPISWVSGIYLLRLLALTPKRFRTHPYFYSYEYFEDDSDHQGDGQIRKPLRDNRRAIILHKTFSRWLSWITQLARNDGADLPVDLTLKTAIKAARIRAAMVFAPGVVAYLSAKLPSPPLDDYSWQAIKTGTIEEVGDQERPTPNLKSELAPVRKAAPALSPQDREDAEKFFRRAELELKNGQSRNSNKQLVSKSIVQLSEKLQPIPDRDGKDAFWGNVRAALLYLASRVRQRNTTLETMLSDLKWLRDVVPGLLGTISLPTLSVGELTELAGSYVRSFNAPSTQRQRRSSLKRFLYFVQKNSARLFKNGLQMSMANWQDPDLKISEYRQPRRILTPHHIDELIGDRDGKDHDLYQTMFACLGFYCGMREGEILALTNKNYSHGITDDLELSYSKTPAGIRRLPVSELIPEPYRSIIVDHLRESGNGRKSKPLIEDALKSLQKLERQLAKRFGASSHTLRHCAASMLVLKLCLAQNLVSGEPVSLGLEQLRRDLKKTQGEQFSRDSVLAFARGLLGPGWRKSWPMTIPVVSKLLGHLEPGVTVQVYLHVIELIAAYTRDLIEWPGLTQVQAAAMSKTSRTTLIKHFGTSGGELYSAEEIASYMAARFLPNDLFGI